MSINAMKLLASTFLLLLFSTRVGAQRCDVDSGFRGSYFNVGYKQRDLVKLFRTLDELPQNVRDRLTDYLRGKLGENFAQKLNFDEGQRLDLERLRKKFPSVYRQNANRGSYALLFYFSDPEKGLKSFFTRMVLNEDGSVNVDIRLPDIASNPAKAIIISCQDAYSIAARSGFPTELSFARFEYSEDQKSFIWIIEDSRKTQPDDPLMPEFNGTYKNIDINANTGQVVRIYKNTIIF